MLKNLTTVLFSTILLSLLIFSSPIEVDAQCVKCSPAPPSGWLCTSASVGGDACQTEGTSCTVIGPCSGGGSGPIGPGDSLVDKCSPTAIESPKIEISDEFIRSMGAIDPYIAIGLLNIRDIRFEFTEAKVSFAPITISQSDVETRLTTLPSASDSYRKEYFRKQKTITNKAFAGKQEPIVYEFNIIEDKYTGVSTLSIRNASVKNSLTEINLVRISEAKESGNRFRALSLNN